MGGTGQRRGPGRPARIDLAAIVECAAEIELDGLTMASVAERLGVAPQSLYRHVPDREALVQLVTDRLVAEWRLPPDDDRPIDEWLYDFACTTRQLLLDHPGLDEQLQQVRPGTPNLIRLIDTTIGVLAGRGLAELDAFLLASTVVNVTSASVLRQRRFAPSDEQRSQHVDALAHAIDEVDPVDVPRLTAVFGAFRQLGPDDFYELTMRSLIDGMLRRLPRT